MSSRTPLLLIVLATLAVTALPGRAQDDGDDPDNPANKPWVGIAMEGRRITMVAAGSPAFRAGLQVDDEVLTFNDTDIDSVQELIAFLAGRKPGDVIRVRVQRGDNVVPLDLTLGSRLEAIGPMGQGGRTTFRSNDEIRSDLVDYEDELSKRFAAHLQDEQLNEQWKALLERRRKQRADRGDAPDPRLEYRDLHDEWQALQRAFRADEKALPGYYKPELQSYVRREPLKFEKVTRDLLGPLEAAAFGDGDNPLRATVVQLGIIRTGLGPDSLSPATRDGENPKDAVTLLLTAMHRAQQRLAEVLGELSDEEQAFLATQLPVMAHRFARHIYLDAGAPRDEFEANLRALALTKKVCRHNSAPFLLDLTEDLCDWFSRSALGMLRQLLADADPFTVTADGLTASVNGGGNPATADLVIDARGDTHWTPDMTRGAGFGEVRVLLDLAGNDTWEAPDFNGIGSAVGGIGIAIDFAGNDRYLARRMACGSAMLGVGILQDLAGHDTILGDAYIGGTALFGTGLLLDSAGNDTRKANLYSWGMAGPGAIAACLDGDGEDHSIADGRYPTSYGAPEREYEGNSFGFAIGFRQLAAGGIAIYSDHAGHDIVSAGEFSIGGSYFLGVGVYHDAAGDDIIHSSRYGVGFGVHSAAGIALDDGGNDIYQGQTAASLGSAWDLGVGMLIDSAGNDVYVAKGLGLGGAAQNGFALLWDKAGNDVYRSRGGTQGEGTAFEYGGGRGAKNFGLLWDDGGTDSYNRPGLADGVTRLRGTIGIAADR